MHSFQMKKLSMCALLVLCASAVYAAPEPSAQIGMVTSSDGKDVLQINPGANEAETHIVGAMKGIVPIHKYYRVRML